MENIILIEQNAIRELENMALRTWSPVLEKAVEDFSNFSENSKRFLCRFCHEYSLVESSTLQSDTGIMNILSPTGQPTELKSMLPLLIKILGKVVTKLDYSVNFHISSIPEFKWINVSNGTLNRGHNKALNVNQQYDASNEFIGTNYAEVYEEVFIIRAVDLLIEEFKKYEDVVVYPAWHINESTITDIGLETRHIIRLTGRFMGIELKPEKEEKPEIKFAGYWEIGGEDSIEVYLRDKPKAFHRFMIKLLFGIKWIDKETTGPVNG
jgi:hypothetical protein